MDIVSRRFPPPTIFPLSQRSALAVASSELWSTANCPYSLLAGSCLDPPVSLEKCLDMASFFFLNQFIHIEVLQPLLQNPFLHSPGTCLLEKGFGPLSVFSCPAERFWLSAGLTRLFSFNLFFSNDACFPWANLPPLSKGTPPCSVFSCEGSGGGPFLLRPVCSTLF